MTTGTDTAAENSRQQAAGKRMQVFHEWQSRPLWLQDGHYHILCGGTLKRKEGTLSFENEEMHVSMPVQQLKALNLQADIHLDSGVLQLAAQKGVPVNFFDSFGRYLGSFAPQYSKTGISTALRQMQLFMDMPTRLSYASAIEAASLKSAEYNLRYYQMRGGLADMKEELKTIAALRKTLLTVTDPEKLLLTEARAREIYYSCFNRIMHNENFHFTKRTRMPPEDPINCLISYCNAIVYRRAADEIYRSDLDIRIGFAHVDLGRKENLNLDIAELFKPVIADKVIFRMVNRNMFNMAEDFASAPGGAGVWLTAIGKRKVNEELRRRLFEKMPGSPTNETCEAALRHEIRHLSACIREDAEYSPCYMR